MHQSMACSSLTGWLGEAHSEPCICTSLTADQLQDFTWLIEGTFDSVRDLCMRLHSNWSG